MSKKIKNIDLIAHVWGGVQIEPSAFYECQNQTEADYFFKDDNFILSLSTSLAEVYSDSTLINGVSASLLFLSNGPKVDSNGNAIVSAMPFASKTIGTKKLFKRVHGIQQECIVGENIFEFVVPYPSVKMACIELIGATNCDQVDLEVYDTPTGAISTIPNCKLNQFGFKANISKDYYEQKSEFDADLIQGMKIEVHYFARNTGMIGINFILNELK